MKGKSFGSLPRIIRRMSSSLTVAAAVVETEVVVDVVAGDGNVAAGERLGWVDTLAVSSLVANAVVVV